MTESEWTSSPDPYLMLWFVNGKDSDRKMRLFIIACCRRVWDRLLDQRSRQAIESAEQYVEGECSNKDRKQAYRQAKSAMLESDRGLGGDAAWALRGQLVAMSVADKASASSLRWLFNESAQKMNPTGDDKEKHIQADLLRDLFGPLLFRRLAIKPEWLTSTVVALAQSIYNDAAFDRMPILADALEDAGCDDADILAHCRSSGSHIRGCWVVDLILGKK